MTTIGDQTETVATAATTVQGTAPLVDPLTLTPGVTTALPGAPLAAPISTVTTPPAHMRPLVRLVLLALAVVGALYLVRKL